MCQLVDLLLAAEMRLVVAGSGGALVRSWMRWTERAAQAESLGGRYRAALHPLRCTTREHEEVYDTEEAMREYKRLSGEWDARKKCNAL